MWMLYCALAFFAMVAAVTITLLWLVAKEESKQEGVFRK